MKKLFLILLASVSILNAQFLELMQERNLIELNPNPYFANWSYTESVVNGTMESWASSSNLNNWSEDYLTATYYHSDETTVLHGGSHSAELNITGNSTNPSWGRYYYTISGAAGKVFKYDAYLYNVNAISSGYAGILFSDAGSGYATLTYSNSTGNGTWEHKNGVFGGSVGNILIQLRLESGTTQTSYFDDISVQQLVAPTGFTSPTMNATNYVVQSNGCKFVEATGTTYIETSSALTRGTRKFKVTQDWTQGRLSISNGTTSVNLNQSDGTQTVSLYFDGTQKMKVECTNNTISTISLLSIK